MKVLNFLFLILFSTFVHAESWTTNKDHSEILFKVPYMGVSELTGRFNEFSAEVALDKDLTPLSPLKVEISSGSIDTGNKMRDGHLKGSDFFQANTHPFITFTSSKIVKVGADKFKAEGHLILRGISNPLVITFTMTKAIKDTWGHSNIFVKFDSSLSRKDYKINWNKSLNGQEYLIGEIVTFSGIFQLQPLSDKTPNSKHMIPDTDYIRQRDENRQKTESGISRKLRNLINGKNLND